MNGGHGQLLLLCGFVEWRQKLVLPNIIHYIYISKHPVLNHFKHLGTGSAADKIIWLRTTASSGKSAWSCCVFILFYAYSPSLSPFISMFYHSLKDKLYKVSYQPSVLTCFEEIYAADLTGCTDELRLTHQQQYSLFLRCLLNFSVW